MIEICLNPDGGSLSMAVVICDCAIWHKKWYLLGIIGVIVAAPSSGKAKKFYFCAENYYY